jgi:hypothetical protein
VPEVLKCYRQFPVIAPPIVIQQLSYRVLRAWVSNHLLDATRHSIRQAISPMDSQVTIAQIHYEPLHHYQPDELATTISAQLVRDKRELVQVARVHAIGYSLADLLPN